MGYLLGELLKHAVWAKGTPIPGYAPDTWRRDEYGNVMKYSDFGNRESEYGWERDHIVALALGGPDTADIPLLEYEPGATLPESNAIMHYLAEGRLPTQRPARPRPRPGVDVLRAVQSRALHRDLVILDQVSRPRGGSPRRVGQAPRTGIRRAWRHGAAPRARLPYFVGERCTIADIALYAYTHVAHEGGFSLAGFPAVRAWIARVEDEPGYAPMT